MKRAEREAILKQGVVRPETAVDRRARESLVADLEGSPVRGRPLPLRLRNFRPSAESYLASIGGPLPYMVRAREIERLVALTEAALEEAWHGLASECGHDQRAFASRWSNVVAEWDFAEVNDLIDRHNRWYPAESRLPMDPARRDYALVNGADYRRRRLDAAWALERFPARLGGASAPGSRGHPARDPAA